MTLTITMTPFLLHDGTRIDVPSLGFGPEWRPARRLLAQLHRVRSLPLAPLTVRDLLATLLGLGRSESDFLETENRLWRELFASCQARVGYSRRECRHLLDFSLTYADRHAYEQLLLFGEATADARGLKKKSPPAPTARGNASGSAAASNGSASSASASLSRGNSPRPTSSPSAPAKEARPPFGSASPFWIRPSPRPTTRPASPSSPSSKPTNL